MHDHDTYTSPTKHLPDPGRSSTSASRSPPTPASTCPSPRRGRNFASARWLGWLQGSLAVRLAGFVGFAVLLAVPAVPAWLSHQLAGSLAWPAWLAGLACRLASFTGGLPRPAPAGSPRGGGQEGLSLRGSQAPACRGSLKEPAGGTPSESELALSRLSRAEGEGESAIPVGRLFHRAHTACCVRCGMYDVVGTSTKENERDLYEEGLSAPSAGGGVRREDAAGGWGFEEEPSVRRALNCLFV